MTSTLDQEISDFATSIFLRRFRSTTPVSAVNPSLDIDRDIDILRSFWSISKSVREFLQYLLANRHEAQALLQFRQRSGETVARGRIDARATILMRRTTGNHSLIVSHEPIRSFNTGPNQIVAWVVQMAAFQSTRLYALQPDTSSYLTRINDVMEQILAVKRLDAIREPSKNISLSRRPGLNAIRDASRSRRMIYRLAIDAYRTLTEIESGNEDTLTETLRDTLLGPLEKWRRFELAVALGVGEAISNETGDSLHFSIIDAGKKQPILKCGKFSIFWQTGSEYYSQPSLEPSEMRAKDIIHAYGMETGMDRPDIAIANDETREVISIIEVKYHTDDTTNARFREAARQIARYARGYQCDAKVQILIEKSLIALSLNAPTLISKATGVRAPASIDFAGVMNGKLTDWITDKLLA